MSVRDFNRLSWAVLTAISKGRPMRLELTDGRVISGHIVASGIDREIERRNKNLRPQDRKPTRSVTVEGHEPFPIVQIESARWA